MSLRTAMARAEKLVGRTVYHDRSWADRRRGTADRIGAYGVYVWVLWPDGSESQVHSESLRLR